MKQMQKKTQYQSRSKQLTRKVLLALSAGVIAAGGIWLQPAFAAADLEVPAGTTIENGAVDNQVQNVYGSALHFSFGDNGIQNVRQGGYAADTSFARSIQNVYGEVDISRLYNNSVQNIYEGGVAGQLITGKTKNDKNIQNIYDGGIGTSANLFTSSERHVFKGGAIKYAATKEWCILASQRCRILAN